MVLCLPPSLLMSNLLCQVFLKLPPPSMVQSLVIIKFYADSLSSYMQTQSSASAELAPILYSRNISVLFFHPCKKQTLYHSSSQWL